MSGPGFRLWVYAGLAATGIGVATLLLADRPKLKPGMKVFLLGDSLAVGLSVPLRALSKDYGIVFQSMGKVGSRIDQWALDEDMYDAVQKFQPDLVLVSLGTNDEYLAGDGGSRQAPFLDKLLYRLRGVSKDVVWIGPPKLPKAGTNGVIPEILKAIPRSHYIPSQEYDIPRAPDQLHPTIAGYAYWASLVWRHLS